MLVSKNGPAVIIEMMEPAVSSNALSWSFHERTASKDLTLIMYKQIAIGTSTIASNTKMVFSALSIWERGFLYCFARPVKPAM